jgi:lipoyl-dependent peroxiredoxin
MAVRIVRRAKVQWTGPESGSGRISLGSGAFDGEYSLRSRVEDTPQTNPEELIGAASAACFTMSLANLLEEEGHTGIELSTTATVYLEPTDAGWRITRIELDSTGRSDDVDEAQFTQLALQAKNTCPVSRALAGTEISLAAHLAPAPA